MKVPSQKPAPVPFDTKDGATTPAVPVYVRVFAVVAPSSRLASEVGADPAPPPRRTCFEASNADELSVVVLEKYGIPPDVVVPLTVAGKARDAVGTLPIVETFHADDALL